MLTTWTTFKDKFLFFAGVIMGNVWRSPGQRRGVKQFNGRQREDVQPSTDTLKKTIPGSSHNLQESIWKNELYYYVFEKYGCRFFIGPYEPRKMANGVPSAPPLKVGAPLPANTEIMSLLQVNDLFLDETHLPLDQRVNHKLSLETLIWQKIRDYEWDFLTVAQDRRRYPEKNVYWRVIRDERGVVERVEFFTAEYYPDFPVISGWEKPFVVPINRVAELLAPLGTEKVVFQSPV